MLDPKRTVAELKELRALTGDENGAQRVAFTRPGRQARAWLQKKVEGLPGVEIHNDAAGNLWATLRGESEKRCSSAATSIPFRMAAGSMAV